MDRSSCPEVFCKKDVLKNLTKFTGKDLCQSLFFNKIAGLSNFIKKETLEQVLSCEFCEISKNTFSYRTPPMAASEWTYRAQANGRNRKKNHWVQDRTASFTLFKRNNFFFTSD